MPTRPLRHTRTVGVASVAERPGQLDARLRERPSRMTGLARASVPVQCLKRAQLGFRLIDRDPREGLNAASVPIPARVQINTVKRAKPPTTGAGRSTSWGSLVRAQYRPSSLAPPCSRFPTGK